MEWQAPGIVLGKELASRLGVIEGDLIYLISTHGMLSPIGHLPAMKQFKVTGFFQSGMYEYDQTFAFIHLKDAQKMLRIGDTVTGIDIRVRDIYAARKIAASSDALVVCVFADTGQRYLSVEGLFETGQPPSM